MNLDEYKAYIKATRQASKQEAMSVLSATISNNPNQLFTTKESE